MTSSKASNGKPAWFAIGAVVGIVIGYIGAVGGGYTHLRGLIPTVVTSSMEWPAAAASTGGGMPPCPDAPSFVRTLLAPFKRHFGDASLLSPQPYTCPFKGDKWAVLTTIQGPTKAVRTLARQPGWSVLVVGDTKTPSNWMDQLGADDKGNVLFLSIDTQRRLPYRLAALTPERSYTRKNLGYLVAIQCGARVIYETDDDNELLDPSVGIRTLSASAGLDEVPLVANRSAGAPIINVYSHFGRRDLWPRGIPLEMLSATTDSPYDVSVPQRPVRAYVQQYLADLDPDVDAILRLTQPQTITKVHFDPKARSFAVAPGVFTPYNTQNTIQLYEGFWGLLLPSTVTFRVTDILRGYWVQRLLWDIGGCLVFGGPTVIQERNPHSYLDDFKSEAQLFVEAGEMVTKLGAWRSDAPTLFGRIAAMAASLREWGFWAQGDVDAVQAWLADLTSVGYAPPPLLPAGSPEGDPLRVIVDPKAPLSDGAALVCVTGLADRGRATIPTIPRLKSYMGWDKGGSNEGRVDVFVYASTARSHEEDLDDIRSLNTTRTVLYRDPIIVPPIPARVQVSMQFDSWPVDMYYQQMLALAECYDMAEAYATAHRINYRYFVRLRTDHELSLFKPAVAASVLAEKAIVVPNDRHYSGVNDRFAIGTPQQMRVYMRRYYNLSNPVISTPKAPDLLHPERHLDAILKANGIQWREVTMDYGELPHPPAPFNVYKRYRGKGEARRV